MKQEIQAIDRKDFAPIVHAIGADIEQTQVRIVASANADMLFHYWKVGHFILYLQEKEGWGAKVIDKLSEAIRSQYPDKKGYSRRNIFYMCRFASAYPLNVLQQMCEADSMLSNPSVDAVKALTTQLNQLVQEPLALIPNTEDQPIEITQEPLAQLGEVAQTLSSVYQTDIEQIETLFKRSAVVRTNWASHVILRWIQPTNATIPSVVLNNAEFNPQMQQFHTRNTEKLFGCNKGCNSLSYTLICGERGIRTPGTLPYYGFQDRRIRPLCHFSDAKIAPFFEIPTTKKEESR